MSRRSLRALVLALATIMCCALVAGSAQAASKTDKKQNSSIKKNRSNTKKATTAAKKARAEANKVDLRAFKALLVAVKATYDVAAINNNVVPAAIKGLTDLQNGLLALKAGLEQAGAGLGTLAALAQSDEYGVVSIAVGGTPLPGCFYETANIPDNLQDAMVAGTCNIPANVAVGGGAISINAGIRSNESDGAATGEPAGVAGIVSYNLTQTSLGTVGTTTALGFGATGANAALGGAPAQAIQLKSPPTSTTETSFAFAPISTDNFVDLGTAANGFAGSGAPVLPPTTGAPTYLRTIQFTVRFNDLSTNAATDPTS